MNEKTKDEKKKAADELSPQELEYRSRVAAADRKRNEAAGLLVHYFGVVGGRTGWVPNADCRREIESIVDMLFDAAVEMATATIRFTGGAR